MGVCNYLHTSQTKWVRFAPLVHLSCAHWLHERHLVMASRVFSKHTMHVQSSSLLFVFLFGRDFVVLFLLSLLSCGLFFAYWLRRRFLWGLAVSKVADLHLLFLFWVVGLIIIIPSIITILVFSVSYQI